MCMYQVHVCTFALDNILGALSLVKKKLLFHAFDRKFPPEKLSKLILLE